MTRLLMISGLALLILQAGCSSVKGEKGEHGPTHGQEGHGGGNKLLVTSPVKKDTSISDRYVCQIHAKRHIELKALEKGYITEVLVNEGEYVEKGELMFKIMPRVYKAELQKAKAEARAAKIEYRNTKRLRDSNVVSRNELKLDRAEYQKAKAERSLAKAHMSFTKIRAPFSGLMNRLHERKGSLVEEGARLTSISDISELWVYFNVPEAEYLNYMSRVEKDSSFKVRLLMANDELYEHPGTANVIEGQFNHETGNIAFRATFPNPDRLLRHGETGNIIWKRPLDSALIIPQRATYEILNKKYVYTVNDDNVVHQRAIEVGHTLEDLYAIEKGLERNDRILYEGIRHVKDGDTISYKALDADSLITHQKRYTQ